MKDVEESRLIAPEMLDRSLSQRWLATTNPGPESVLRGMRAMLETVYWDPLIDTRFQTWGTKEVALTAQQMSLLVTLFPDASFVCVIRDPVQAYLSFRSFIVSGTVAGWRRGGDALESVSGPLRFARLWSQAASKFRAMAQHENVHVFRYEDVNADTEFPARLGADLDMTLDPEAWVARVGEAPAKRRTVMSSAELAVLKRACGSEASRWGYSWT